jgi:hypothetical protein
MQSLVELGVDLVESLVDGREECPDLRTFLCEFVRLRMLTIGVETHLEDVLDHEGQFEELLSLILEDGVIGSLQALQCDYLVALDVIMK